MPEATFTSITAERCGHRWFRLSALEWLVEHAIAFPNGSFVMMNFEFGLAWFSVTARSVSALRGNHRGKGARMKVIVLLIVVASHVLAASSA